MENKLKPEKYSWTDVTVSQYKRIAALPKDEDWAWNALAVLEGITYADVMNAPIEWTISRTNYLKDFFSTQPKIGMPRHRYHLGGTDYVLTQNPADVTTAQYFDYVNAPKEIPQNLGLLLAILMVPEGKEYNDGYSLEKSVTDIENNLDVQSALGIANFWTGCFRLLLKTRLRKARKALKAAKKEGIPTERAERQVKEALRELSLFTQ